MDHVFNTTWRFRLREAEEALKAGRLEESRRLLAEGELTEFLPGKRLAARLAARFAERARQWGQTSDWEAGWRDLEVACSLADENAELPSIRRALIAAAVRDAQASLGQGNTAAALATLGKLARRKVPSAELQSLGEAARRLEAARYLCRQGRFADAESRLAEAMGLCPEVTDLAKFRDACRAKFRQGQGLTDQLHRALGEGRWQTAASLSDQLLGLSPECHLARDARRRAWAEVGAQVTESQLKGLKQTWLPGNQSQLARDTGGNHERPAGPRFLLWVDGVGGYLVCLAEEIVCGQASPGNPVDVPLLADISRRHVRIRREGEAYVLEPLHATKLGGRPIQSRALLSDGEEIELGNGVCLRFRQPHALSGSARLDFVSRHRTQPYADGVLLMAESCVLGPKWQNHVVCRNWTGDVVLYRQEDALYCRAMESIEIDGHLCDGRGRLDGNARVVGNDFSMSLEELDKCLTQPLR